MVISPCAALPMIGVPLHVDSVLAGQQPLHDRCMAARRAA